MVAKICSKIWSNFKKWHSLRVFSEICFCISIINSICINNTETHSTTAIEDKKVTEIFVLTLFVKYINNFADFWTNIIFSR